MTLGKGTRMHILVTMRLLEAFIGEIYNFSDFCRQLFNFFTALHGMQTRSSYEKAVRPSAKRVDGC